MRVALKIAYNGTHFFGSQIQTETQNTIIGNIQKVLQHLGISDSLVASGRTDKGVHAQGQVCHLDLPEFWRDTNKLQNAMNSMLPSTIFIKKITQVSEDFHARYSAKKRTYRYIIKEGKSNPFEADFITFVKHIDFEDLKKKISLYQGEHDFKNFMKTGSETSSSKRVIYKTFVYKKRGFIILNFQANGFLRSQIRLMVGALLHLTEQQIREKLACIKNHQVKPAPPNGLYLSSIHY